MDCSLPGSSIHGIFQARVLEWGAIAFSNNELDIIKYAKITKFQLQNLEVKILIMYKSFEKLKLELLALRHFTSVIM